MSRAQIRSMSTAQEAAVYRKWRTWIRKIRADVSSVLVKRYMFREVQKMVQDNPQIQVPSIFWTWMRQTYYGDVALSIRRQVDKNPRTISLYRLLTDIARHPEILLNRPGFSGGSVM